MIRDWTGLPNKEILLILRIHHVMTEVTMQCIMSLYSLERLGLPNQR